MKPIQNLTRLAAVFGIAFSSLHAAPVINDPFTVSDASLTGNATGTGLSGNWTATASWDVLTGSMLWGSLATSGNHVQADSGGAASAAVGAGVISPTLLADGATLWFSMIYTTTPVVSGNPDAGFALGTDSLGSTNNIPMNSSGSGIGFSIKSGVMSASTWTSGTNGRATDAAGSEGVTGSTTYLIVGEIIWGAGTDTINLYRPTSNLTLGPVVATRSVALTQSAFDTISYGQKADSVPAYFDEIRFGATSADVLPVETVPPTLLSITDNMAGGPIGEDVEVVTYTLTFDKHMDISTIDGTDFDNAGSAAYTVGSVTQVSPGVITVQLLPTGTGTLQLRIPSGKVLKSFPALDLDTTSAILDDTTITINAGNTPNTPGDNRWWDLATSGVTNGVSQGGTGNWNTATTNWDRGAGFEAPVAWDNANANTAIFGGTAGTVTLDENITLNGLTVSLPIAGGSGYSIGNVGEDHTLTFTGDKLVTVTATGSNTNQDTIIRAGIAGAPTMNIAARATDADNFNLLPGAGVTQTIGTLNMLNTFGSNKKLILGGTSTGNVVDTVTWSVTNQQMFLTKRGAGDWTITNDLAFSTNRATRLYVEQGTLTLGGTNNSTTHKVGVGTAVGTGFTATNLASKLIAKGTFTINDNREYFFVQNAGTLSPGPGVETLTVRWNSNSAGTHGQFNMQTGSTYEWDVASNISTDIINVQRGGSSSGSLTLGDMTIKVNDAGVTTPIASTDQLTAFTYQTGVTRSIGTVTIDTTALGAGWSGTPSLVDNGTGTIYITGLTFSGGATYTVTYDDNDSDSGAAPVDGATYATGATVTVLGNTGSLVKTGLVFTGWNTLANGLGTHYNAAATFPMGSANVTLYADWRTPYQAWLLANSKTDTDANRKEYAFGTTNTAALVLNAGGTAIVSRGQAPIVTTTEGSAFVKLTYARRKNSGFTFAAEYSDGLVTWLPSNHATLIYNPSAPAGETIVDNGDEMEIVSINFPVFRDVGGGSYVKIESNFCRIVVTTN